MMQQGLLMSLAMYRAILKPIHADYAAFIKARTRAKLFFHLPMLKKRYGRNLTFCGAIDTRDILPFGTPDDVRREVRRMITLLGSEGGFLVSSVHTIINVVPPENIVAMADAVEEFGRYPLQ